jgi:general L-amino acid transport system permease protein
MTLPSDRTAGRPLRRIEDVAVPSLWRRPWMLRIGWQVLAVLGVVWVALAVAGNLSANLPRANLGFGLDFLHLPTRFEIGDNLLGATARDPVWMAFVVGFINTVRVSALAILLCTGLGLVVALARLSRNWLVAHVAFVYIETVRNVPLLLQMLFWYALSTLLPMPKQAWEPVPGVFFTNRGVYLPAPALQPGHLLALGILAAGTVAFWRASRADTRVREATGQPSRRAWGVLAAALAAALAVVVAGPGLPALEVPALKGFNFRGGISVTPEFVAVLLALGVYQSGFAAETIRSGILGVPGGQTEAARSLGLPPRLVLRKVVLPQALRIIVPPMTGQYMSLIKNSSLAVVIGYPELVRVSTAVIAETGRAIECIAILMAVYLTLSLLTSAFMNWYNHRIAIREG